MTIMKCDLVRVRDKHFINPSPQGIPTLCSMLYALCSMLYALCSMLYALISTLYSPLSTLAASGRYDLAITIFSFSNTFNIPKLMDCFVA